MELSRHNLGVLVKHNDYHLFDNFEEYRTFVNVGDGFVNINTSNDYINLINN